MHLPILTHKVWESQLFAAKCVLLDLQDMQSLQTIGTDVPVRLAVDRVSLYVAEITPFISKYRAHVLDVQTQYADGLEDFVKAVFVRGIEDAITARDAWHHDKVCFDFSLGVIVLKKALIYT